MDSTEPWSGPTLVVVCVCWTQTMSVYVCVCVCVNSERMWLCLHVLWLKSVSYQRQWTLEELPKAAALHFGEEQKRHLITKTSVSAWEREREREKERERECMCAAVYVWPCTAHTHDWGNELWVTSVMFAGRFENLEEVQCKIRLTHSNLWYWQPQRRQHAPPLFITHNYIRYHSLDLAGP